jgi:hypothetical protein
VTRGEVLEAERQAIDRSFGGDRDAYLAALRRAHATVTLARSVIRDELRRRAIADGPAAASGQTMLEWTADREARAVDTAICVRDDIPGRGGFPRTDSREVGVVPVLERLPFLFGDDDPPSAPAAAAAPAGAGLVRLTWEYGSEPDLAGYRVFRSDTSGGPSAPVGPFLDRPTLVDTEPRGTTSYYTVRAIDTSGNQSEPSREVAATSP